MRIIKSRRFAMLRERGGHQFVGLELRASMDNVSDQASLEPERVGSCSYSVSSKPRVCTSEQGVDGEYDCDQDQLRADEVVQKNERTTKSSLLNIPTKSHVLVQPTICEYCGAKKFHRENKGFCCSDGKVKLHVHSVPN
ncbi:uncharacterized protein LOC111388318 isoform X2 [Olea europaea var. sylvestris]|uniref:uncharacterized protein LOC111388318 isoform X2 n=1 Tax=Olea europaea var. sylvestris TaxID=158386 RepID=UPI000C1D25E7|nr:uncharacterized protein LOC111388318 isoform X2 [Olea europaea var. sylvestris]